MISDSATRKVTRRRLLQGAAGAGSIVLLTSCDTNVSSPSATSEAGVQPTATATRPSTDNLPTPARANSTTFAWWSDVGNMTPFQVSPVGPGGVVMLSLIYDTLTWKNSRGIIPWLASKWDVSSDGREYTFTIVDGALWHDGKPVSAGDVAFSFDYYARHPFRWMSTDMVESTAVIGNSQVRVGLKQPYAPFLEEIAGIVPIIPRHIWKHVADPIRYSRADSAIGSGPFALESHNRSGGSYRLSANDRYWRGKPQVREWRQISVSPEQQVQVVKQGEADISLSADVTVKKLVTNDHSMKVFETAPLSVVRLIINTEKPPLNDIKVRQAIAYALNRKLIAKTITHGFPIVGSAGGVVPPETPWFNPNLPPYRYDPRKARELLANKHYTVDLLAGPDDKEPDLMQPMLAEVGIKLNVQRVDQPTQTSLSNSGKFEMALTSHIGVGGDPDYLRRWYTGDEANAFAQGSKWRDPEYMKLATREAVTMDVTKRRQIVFRMQEIMAEQLPTIVLYHRRFYWLYHPSAFTPMRTWGGLMDGIPFPDNKLTLIRT